MRAVIKRNAQLQKEISEEGSNEGKLRELRKLKR